MFKIESYTKMLENVMAINTKLIDLVFKSESHTFLNLGRRQIFAMISLYNHRVVNMSTLAKNIGVSNQQLTKIIDHLTERKLVQRNYDPNNRRVIMLSLTEEGEKLIGEYEEHVKNTVEEFYNVNPRYVEIFLESLDNFNKFFDFYNK